MTTKANNSDGNFTHIDSVNTASLMIEDNYEVKFEHLDKLGDGMDNTEGDDLLDNLLACESEDHSPDNQNQTEVEKNHDDFQNDSHRCIENADAEFASMVLIEKKTEKQAVYDAVGSWTQEKEDVLEINADEVSGFSVVDLNKEPFTTVKNIPDGKEIKDCYMQLETLTDEEFIREKDGLSDIYLSIGTSNIQNAGEDTKVLHVSEFSDGDKYNRTLDLFKNETNSAESSRDEVDAEGLELKHGKGKDPITNQEKNIHGHDNDNVTNKEDEAVKEDSSITEQDIDNAKNQEKIGNLLIIETSSNVDSGCPEETTKTPDLNDGHTNNEKAKKKKAKGFWNFWTNDDEEYKKNRKLAMEKFVYFWLKDDVFSQWHESKFVVDGETFCNAEQYMMYKKADLFGDVRIASEIMKTSDPRMIKALGREVSNFHEPLWRDQSLHVVKTANLAKVTLETLKAMYCAELDTGKSTQCRETEKVHHQETGKDSDLEAKGAYRKHSEARDTSNPEFVEDNGQHKETVDKSHDCNEPGDNRRTEDIEKRKTTTNFIKEINVNQQSATHLKRGGKIIRDKPLVHKANKHYEAKGTEQHLTSSVFTESLHLVKKHEAPSNNNPAERIVVPSNSEKYEEEFPGLSGAKATKEDPGCKMKKKPQKIHSSSFSNAYSNKDKGITLINYTKMDSLDMQHGVSNTPEVKTVVVTAAGETFCQTSFNNVDNQSNMEVFQPDGSGGSLNQNDVKIKEKNLEMGKCDMEEDCGDKNETIVVEYQDKANVLLSASSMESDIKKVPHDEATFAKAAKDNNGEHQDKMNSMIQSEPRRTNESDKGAISTKSGSGDVVEHDNKSTSLLSALQYVPCTTGSNASDDGAAGGKSFQNERAVADQSIDVGTKPKEKLCEQKGSRNKDDKRKPDKNAQKAYPGMPKKVTESKTKKKKK